MRIVLDLQACQASNRERGIGRYAMSLALHMAKLASSGGRNHEVRIVLNGQFLDSIPSIQHVFRDLLPASAISIFETPTPAAGADPANGWRSRAGERLREHYLASLAPDIVHVASLFEGWGDDAVTSVKHGAIGGGVTAVTLFDLIPLMRPQAYLGNPSMLDWYYRKLQSLKSADLLLAISEFSRHEAIDVLHLPPERVVNISSAIDPSFARRTLTPDEEATLRYRYGLSKPFLMYTGGIDPRKNIEALIEAFAQLPPAVLAAHQLAIVCNVHEADRQRLMTLAKRNGLGRGALVLTGYVPDADLIALYNLASAFVFPSLHEGFGLPALEAMACGTPTIGSNASSIPEVIGLDGALFDPTDPLALRASILRVLTDQAWRDRLRTHGLAQARRFSWETSAERTLAAFEALHASRAPIRQHSLGSSAARPRLAFLSPLPPDKSGIADYSADLLKQLVAVYDIDVIAQSAVQDPWILATCRVRSIAWFEQHGARFDRILYHFGNSAFHEHMFGLLGRFPGVVVLHDFFLSGIINYIDHTGYEPRALERALYDSHGYAALAAQQQDRQSSIWAHPCNRQVLDDAAGVIVHSQYAKQLAVDWYGPDVAADWTVLPFPRTVASGDRQAARARLGIADEIFLTCSFGLLGSAKLNDRLLDAWLQSPMAQDPRCRLVFVGENDPSVFGASLTRSIAASGCDARISITGFASRETYCDYLQATDSAVQLRGKSRGETSAAIMDCLAYGVPTIINANGSAAELPPQALLKIDDNFSQEMLRDALAAFYQQPEKMAEYGRAGRAYVAGQHHPYRIGRLYCEAIERFCANGRAATQRQLVRSLTSLEAPVPPAAQDWAALARCVSLNRGAPFGARQLLVDVSELVRRDAKSGIQRVVRNILYSLLKSPPVGFRVEPVYEVGGEYRYARQFTCAMLALDQQLLDDSVVEAHAGDIYLGLDLLPHLIPDNHAWFAKLRQRGVALYFVVYDLLPALRPDVFLPGAEAGFTRWLDSVTALADGLVCISRAVADELTAWLHARRPARHVPVRIGHFHLGADIPSTSAENAQTHPQADTVLSAMKSAPAMLMVGTLEPRKGHALALDAFELLWKQGSQARLVIVGKQGWMVEALVERLRRHPELGARLFWVEGATDALLLNIYANAAALLAASEAEGFGLPLIEAAQHGVPIIARDIPVFVEVAGAHAYYFEGTAPENLAAGITNWLKLRIHGAHPTSHGLRWNTWEQSARQLMNFLHFETPESSS